MDPTEQKPRLDISNLDQRISRNWDYAKPCHKSTRQRGDQQTNRCLSPEGQLKTKSLSVPSKKADARILGWSEAGTVGLMI